MTKTYLFFLLLLSMSTGFTIDKPMIELRGAVTSGEEKLEGVSITIYSENYEVVVQQRVTSASGKYEKIELAMGETYVMEVAKKGYIPKRIIIDSKEGFYEDDTPMIVPMNIPFELDRAKDFRKKEQSNPKHFLSERLRLILRLPV